LSVIIIVAIGSWNFWTDLSLFACLGGWFLLPNASEDSRDLPSSAYSTAIQYRSFSSSPTQATLIKVVLSCLFQPLTGCHIASSKHARERDNSLHPPKRRAQDTQHPRLQKWERYRYRQIRLQCCLQLDKPGVPFIARTAARLPRLADKRRRSASVSRFIQIYSVYSAHSFTARHGSLLIPTTLA
jgi:hypothetical protein